MCSVLDLTSEIFLFVSFGLRVWPSFQSLASLNTAWPGKRGAFGGGKGVLAAASVQQQSRRTREVGAQTVV